MSRCQLYQRAKTEGQQGRRSQATQIPPAPIISINSDSEPETSHSEQPPDIQVPPAPKISIKPESTPEVICISSSEDEDSSSSTTKQGPPLKKRKRRAPRQTSPEVVVLQDNSEPQSKGKSHFRLEIQHGDLFDAPGDWSLAHCVSRDFAMSAGIARTFRRKFGRVEELKRSGAEVGGVAVLEDHERFL